MRSHRLLRRLGIGVAVLVALAGFAFFVVYSAASNPVDGDPAVVRLWKVTAKRGFMEGASLFVSLREGGGDWLDPEEGAPFQESALHPYFVRVRSDPRTARFYGQGPLDVPEFAAMADFLRGQFPHGYPKAEHVRLDVLEMLDEAEKGAEFACGDITKMLIQLVQAGRGHGRAVQLDGHMVAELWSRRHGKWVVVDGDYDVHYTGPDGVPLSALEIVEAVRSGGEGALEIHVGASPNAFYHQASETVFEPYRRGLAVSYYARWISQKLPRWHPGRSPSIIARAYFLDPTWEQRIYYRWLSDDPAELYRPPAVFRDRAS